MGKKFWDFECNEFISCPEKCSEEMTLAGNQRYRMIIKTANKPNAGCQAPLWIQFVGVNGKSSKTVKFIF